MERIKYKAIESEDVLEFVVFCIEGIAERLSKDPADVYRALTHKSDLLNSYVVPCFEPLHTQGKEYIIDELTSLLEKKGIEI
ncbi:MAG: DUF3791 domain-containing protein [Victivallaceae bacterium]|nr:DUF3791 domain-containing protein [Victivallaceae bacterium]